MSKKKHIVFLESNLTNGLMFFKALKAARSIRITFVTSSLDFYRKGNPKADELLSACDQILEVEDSTAIQSVCHKLETIHTQYPINGIMTFFDLHVAGAAILAQYFGLPHLNLYAARVARNKAKVRELTFLRGITQPGFQKTITFQEALEAAKRIGYPVIVKPNDGSASINTALVMNESELRSAFLQIQKHDSYGTSVLATKEVLIEEYVEGPLVSVECLSLNGKHHVLGVTDRVLGAPPYFTELGGSFPSEISGKETAIQMALEALSSIGFDFGASHTEIILSSKGPRLVEINPRLAGGFVADMISRTLNRDIMLDLVAIALGEEINLHFETHSVSTIMAFIANRSGTLNRIHPSPEANTTNVLRYFFSKKIGDSVRPPMNNNDRLGYVVTIGKNQAESKGLAEKIRDATQFEIQ